MRFFTSDQHFGHKNIITYCDRPFADVDDMTEGLIARHNSVVGPDDEVIMLGDFSFKSSILELVVPRLNGKKKLKCGNHDTPWVGHSKEKADRAKAQYLAAGFIEVDQSGIEYNFRLKNGQLVTLSHMPYTGESDNHDADRYIEYRPKDRGQINLCGHVHEAWTLDPVTRRSINVGVDVWDWTPVSEDTIIDFVSSIS